MRYREIAAAEFIERPNRFIAYVELMGERTKVHVKNTGRCRELLTDHARVYLEKRDRETRSTDYDLVAVEKDGHLVNMDSLAPNKAAGEWLRAGGLYGDVSLVRPETAFGGSRFDFYVESASGRRAFVEVKGVTLEREGAAAFPDAPSERAVKHVEELAEACRQGYEAYLLFVVQMKGVRFVEPNWDTQPAFGEALKEARRAGVRLLAYDCLVREDGMEIDAPLPVFLDSLDRIAEPLLDWYDAGRRILPWREEPTPYHVWLSEIMLQQTRVEAVKPYYDRFLQALPDIGSLAAVEEERLLKLWEGLGYYNRARNLKKAAQILVLEYGGRMPDDYEKIAALPGIGSYTAGAISSIAFGRAYPAVDGNVLRILSRLRADERDILNAKVKKAVEEELLLVMPKDRPGDFNQALMELGAMVCIPNGAPKCDVCPWAGFCRARAEKRTGEFPRKAKKKPRRIEERTILVIQDAQRVALHKRPEKGLLAGMYEFPSLEGHCKKSRVLAYLRELGFSPIRIRELPPAKHVFTHREWQMTGYLIRVDELAEGHDGADEQGFVFVEPGQTRTEYPIPSAFAFYARQVEMGREK